MQIIDLYNIVLKKMIQNGVLLLFLKDQVKIKNLVLKTSIVIKKY